MTAAPTPAGSPKGETLARLTTVLLLAGIAGFAALYFASIGPYWNISPDSASYVGWGRSLAAGSGWGSPPVQPPLTAFVFAAVFRLFPDGYTAQNTLTPVLILLSLGCACLLLSRRSGRNPALLATLLAMAAMPVLYATTQLLSEPVYMICSFGALLLLDGHPDRTGAAGPGGAADSSRLRTWLGGMLIIATVLTRTIGITLALAVLLAEGLAWFRRRTRPNTLRTALAVAALASVPIWQAYSDGSYTRILFRTLFRSEPWAASSSSLSVTDVLHNAGLLPGPGGMLMNGWSSGHFGLDLAMRVMITLAIGWGLWRALRRRAGVTECYMLLYMMAVVAYMLTRGNGAERYLVPVAPLLFYYALEAVRGVGRSVPFPALAWGLGAVVVFAPLRIGWDVAREGVAEAHSSPFGDFPIKRPENFDAQRLAHWLKANTGPDERYAAAQRDMLDVLSERRGDDVLLSYTHSPEALIARLEQGRVRHLLIDRKIVPLSDSLLGIVRTHPESFVLVLELPWASLYEFTPTRKE